MHTRLHTQTDVPLAAYTTLRVGGPARFFVSVRTIADVKDAVQFAHAQNMPWFMIGGGSNVLFPDAGYDGVIIQNDITGITVETRDDDTVRVIAGAGESWDALVEETTLLGFHTLANLSGIPGTVGAAPIQNIGAYGVSFADVCEWVEVYDTQTHTQIILPHEACAFGYRDSLFKNPDGTRYVVTRVSLVLSHSDQPVTTYTDVAQALAGREHCTPQELRDIILSIRQAKFPDMQKFGTAGSFFKNPTVDRAQLTLLHAAYPACPAFPQGNGRYKIPLAWILDHVLGMRGKAHGAVGLFEKQPLVFVTDVHATAQQITELASDVARAVFEKTRVHIEPEVTIVG